MYAFTCKRQVDNVTRRNKLISYTAPVVLSLFPAATCGNVTNWGGSSGMSDNRNPRATVFE